MAENEVFLLSGTRGLVKLAQSPYASEDKLQVLLERYPELLSTAILPEGARLLLVRREAPVPDAAAGPGRWSVDHLFVDRDGVPVLVEVKRSSDSRIRREMIGQMLDYAANAASFWSAESLARDFEATCSGLKADSAMALAEFLDEDEERDGFWSRVAQNLDAGRMRLVFVADEIPLEVQRVVEFLNEQMHATEVRAVEVRQYVGADGGVQTLVPRSVGQTAKAIKRKQAGGGEWLHWDEPALLAALPAAEASLARAILDRVRGLGVTVSFGRKRKQGNAKLHLQLGSVRLHLGSVTSDGEYRIALNNLRHVAPFSDERALDGLIGRFQRVAGLVIPPAQRAGWPTVQLELLLDPAGREAFLEAIEYEVGELRAAHAGPEERP